MVIVKQRILDMITQWKMKLDPFPVIVVKFKHFIDGYESWLAKLVIREDWQENSPQNNIECYLDVNMFRTGEGPVWKTSTNHIEQIDDLDLRFVDPEFISVCEILPKIIMSRAVGCGCHVLNRIEYGYNMGWMLGYDLVGWCPGCGRKLPMIEDMQEEKETGRFERIIV